MVWLWRPTLRCTRRATAGFARGSTQVGTNVEPHGPPRASPSTAALLIARVLRPALPRARGCARHIECMRSARRASFSASAVASGSCPPRYGPAACAPCHHRQCGPRGLWPAAFELLKSSAVTAQAGPAPGAPGTASAARAPARTPAAPTASVLPREPLIRYSVPNFLGSQSHAVLVGDEPSCPVVRAGACSNRHARAHQHRACLLHRSRARQVRCWRDRCQQ